MSLAVFWTIKHIYRKGLGGFAWAPFFDLKSFAATSI